MRALYVTPTSPWPMHSGNRRRIQMIIRGIARVAEVDLLVLRAESLGPVPPDIPVGRVLQGPAPCFARDVRTQSVWLARRVRVPSHLAGLDPAPTRQVLHRWMEETGARYQAVWYDRPLAYLAVGQVEGAAALVDFDDLEDRKLADRLAISGLEQGTWGGPTIPGWRHIARLKTRRNILAWQRLQASIARQVEYVTVCSDEDARSLGVANVAIIPNSYPLAPDPVGRVQVGAPPTLSFVGLLAYRPNRDAMEWFATEILPLVQRVIPSVQLRIVGEAGSDVQALGSLPGITVTGRVERIEDELARADASIAPIRFGGGTRLEDPRSLVASDPRRHHLDRGGRSGRRGGRTRSYRGRRSGFRPRMRASAHRLAIARGVG